MLYRVKDSSPRDNKSLGQFPVWMVSLLQDVVCLRSKLHLILMPTVLSNVSAKDLGTGREQHITITAGSNLSDAEIDKAVKEAAEYEAQDKKRKEGIDVRNDADAMVFQTENALKEVGDKISADDKAKVQAEIDSLKAAIEKTNIESHDRC